MILLHEMTGVQKDMVKRLLVQKQGDALVLVHPFFFGSTEVERAARIECMIATTPNSSSDHRDILRTSLDQYMSQLAQVVGSNQAGNGACFVFEEADHLQRVEALQRLNSTITWVVIPTLERRAQPKYPESRNGIIEWRSNLLAMKELGLKMAQIGGCYCLVDASGPIRNSGNFIGCVNEAMFQMMDAKLFRVAVVPKAIYTLNI